MARRIIQTLDLVDDAALIEFYRNAHRNVWPEVIEGIRSVGITCMDIY
ncbi:MAG: L-rhamnose mutarotase [Muribaculaceae bacterium]|nr:L-rhamnose mutarotase [Muribaculaceae bacterium]